MISVRDRKQGLEGRRQKAEGRQISISFSAFCFLLSAFCFLFPVAVQACSVCGGPPDDPLAHGINRSIVFLMTMPFAVFGSIGGWLFYTYHKSHKSHKSHQREDGKRN